MDRPDSECNHIRHACSEQGGVLELVVEVQQRGGSATFEYMGRQNPVKVQYSETKVDITGSEGQGYWELVGI